MSFHLLFEGVSFSHDSAASPLFSNLSLDFSPGWTGIVGPNGSGKTTLLQLATGRLLPTRGGLRVPRNVVYCPQRTDRPADRFADFLSAADSSAYALAAKLEIGDDWDREWHRLSHGERKRSQIAVALWEASAILALDEPTNHIDKNARDLLAQALSDFGGVGLLVSHDRELLDTLAHHCVFVDPPGAEMRRGGYTHAKTERDQEARASSNQRQRLDLAHQKLEREFKRRRINAARSHILRSKRGIPIKDHDARFKKNIARLYGSDGDAGRLMNQLKGRLNDLAARRDAIAVRKEYATGIWVGAVPSRKSVLFEHPGGTLRLDSRRSLILPRLTVKRRDRIALTGPNGSGKSTLIRSLTESLKWPDGRLLYLPQEVTAADSVAVLERIKAMPRNDLGRIMQTISRLGSRPERLLGSAQPSPGETRKLLVALGIQAEPWMIVMDEPTNHLDLPSIECMEEALRECPCALLLASHDETFLDALTTIRWSIESREVPVLRIMGRHDGGVPG